MSRTTRYLLLAFAYAGLVFLAGWQRSWGALALLVVGGVGWVWYRMQVARTEAAERFFADVGEDTRLTALQGASPSEMPVDRPAPPSNPG
jgi:hypothetical protein